MVDKEKIYFFRHYVMPVALSWLANDTYGSVGEQDRGDFEKDFNEILDLALIGLKHKAQLSQEGTTKGTTTDTISRQAAIDAVDAIGHIATMPDGGKCIRKSAVKYTLSMLPPAQPEYEPVTAEDFAKTMSETSVYSYMLWHSEALTLMKKQGFVICKKTM